MIFLHIKILVVLSFILCFRVSGTEVSMSNIFGDHMVLQRDQVNSVGGKQVRESRYL